MRTRLLLLASMAAAVTATAQDESVAPKSVESQVTAPAVAPEVKEPAPEAKPVTPPPSAATPVVAEPAAAPAAAVSQRSKDTLSQVDFPEEEIRTILRNVADLFELNLVIPDTLQGRTSLKLREVTWRQIFQVVLSPIGYSFVEDGNIIKIISTADIELAPMTSQSIKLENVSAMQVEPNLRPLLSSGVKGQNGRADTPGGTIVVNKFANELIITDRPDRLVAITQLAKSLDSSPKQIVIEAKFVEITLNDGENREIAAAYSGNNFQITTGTGRDTTGNIGFPFNLNSGQLTGGFPTAVYNRGEFSALANIINSTGRARLVSNPTVVALNGQSSTIRVGRELQLVRVDQQNTSSGGSGQTTATADKTIFIGIEMPVTAQITGSDLVELTVKPVKTSVGEKRKIFGNDFYDVDKREGDLKIMLKSGSVAAIGGFIDDTISSRQSKVPVLGDIPVLGKLFQRSVREKSTTNLVIFVSATVLEANKTNESNTIKAAQLSALKLETDKIEKENERVGKNRFEKTQ